MIREKQINLEKVVKKSKDKKLVEGPLPGLEIHTVKLPPEPKDKGKKPKEKTGDGKKPTEGKRPREKQQTNRKKDEIQQTGQGDGKKTTIQGPTPPRRRITLDRILEAILPPWFY